MSTRTMTTPGFLALLALALTSACEGSPPATKAADPQADQQPSPSPSSAKPKLSTPPVAPPVEVGDDAVSSDAPGSPPPWFRPEAFAHKKVMKRGASETPDGKTSELLLLELEAGTTVEQCIAAAEAKLGESIPELPTRETTPQGYLTVLGEVEGYAFNVVCGVAKGTPTMYLSYSR